jgi:hypothetical protein
LILKLVFTGKPSYPCPNSSVLAGLCSPRYVSSIPQYPAKDLQHAIIATAKAQFDIVRAARISAPRSSSCERCSSFTRYSGPEMESSLMKIELSDEEIEAINHRT